MKDTPTLTDGPITLRPITDADREWVNPLLKEPSVAQWWVPTPGEEPDAELYDDHDDSWVWVIEYEGANAGVLWPWEEQEPVYRHGGLDLSLATAFQGRGIGPAALRMAIRYLIDVRGHHRITIDPAADNARAIAAYSKCGFEPVGRMRAYTLGADGRWHDGLLMELVELPGTAS